MAGEDNGKVVAIIGRSRGGDWGPPEAVTVAGTDDTTLPLYGPLYGPSGEPLVAETVNVHTTLPEGPLDYGDITVSGGITVPGDAVINYPPVVDQTCIDRLEGQVSRLIGILELSEEERAFVRAALGKDTGRDLWLVLADYLAEKGKEEASQAFRKLAE